MRRNNYGFKQVVTEAELDGSFDYVENAERALAIDAGASQEAVADTPGAQAYGGIVDGLVVTRSAANDYVNVSAGTARDDSGRKITIPAATVKITKTGDTPEGDSTDATGDGADITGSCGVGQRIVCSLYAVYDEHEQDERTDGAAAQYFFDILESFHFHLKIGVAFPDPPVAEPTRGALEDGKVLLTDLVLERPVADMQVASGGVCDSTPDWVALTGLYITLDGRRSDNIAIDDIADFPLSYQTGFTLRGKSAREALYALVKQLQDPGFATGDPDGASIIAAKAAAGSDIVLPYAVRSVIADTITNNLANFMAEINNKVSRGGDFRQALFDDFKYKPTAASGVVDPDTDFPEWGEILGGGAGGSYHVISKLGGALKITSPATAGAYRGIQNGYGGVTNGILGFHKLDASPFASCGVRIKVDSVTDAIVRFGLTQITTSGLAEVEVDYDGGTMRCRATDSGGTPGSWSSSAGGPPNGTWLEILLEVILDGGIQLTYNGTTVTATAGGTGSFGSNLYAFFIQSESKTGGASTAIETEIDAVWAGDRAPR
jgi:hypothetical protein